MTSSREYHEAADTVRRPTSNHGTSPDYLELIRLGSLAASSHNTQPWKFTVDRTSILISPDFTRRCSIVDPDDAHLYKSLGCAAENIVHGAAAQGLRADIAYEQPADRVVVYLRPDSTCQEAKLARAIPHRQCTKVPYDGRPIDERHLTALVHAGTGNDVRLIVLASNDQKERATEFVNQGNLAQLSDPAWRNELLRWIRPNDREALQYRDGLSGRTSGQPSIPTWLARLVLPMIVRPKSQIKADTKNIRSSAGIAVFVTPRDDAAAWVETGRCYQRFALTATSLGIRNAFINQPIEVPSVRPSFESWLGLDGEHAQLMVRFGTGPHMPYSLRRPLEDVIGHPE